MWPDDALLRALTIISFLNGNFLEYSWKTHEVISMSKNAICTKCGKEMPNVKEGHADLCYDCTEIQPDINSDPEVRKKFQESMDAELPGEWKK